MTLGTRPFSTKPLLKPVLPTRKQGDLPSMDFPLMNLSTKSPTVTPYLQQLGNQVQHGAGSAPAAVRLLQCKDKKDGGQGEEVAQGIYYSGA